MKLLAALPFAFITVRGTVILHDKRAQPQGIDVSGHQPGVNWATVKANGVTFAYIKATEGTSTLHVSHNFEIPTQHLCSVQELRILCPVHGRDERRLDSRGVSLCPSR
jgi:hypothetical protein